MENGKKQGKVTIVRASPIFPDPRVEKEAMALSGAGYDISVLGWDRQGETAAGAGLKDPEGKHVADVRRIRIKAPYGGGFRNIMARILFQWAILYHLIADRHHPDIVHACDFDTVLPALLFVKLFRKRLVYDIFDFYADTHSMPGFFRKWIARIDRFAINHADAVILCAEERREQLAGCHPKRTAFVYNTPADLDLEDTDLPSSCNMVPDNLSLGYVGTLATDRLLLEIIGMVGRRKDLSLRMAGFGTMQSEVVAECNKYANIQFLGRLSYREALEVESKCDILFAFYDPSVANNRYAAPNKLYEAMMLGKPVIVARGTGIDHLVEAEGIGEAADFNIASFEEAVNRLAADPAGARSMGARARCLYERKYRWEESVKSLLALYEDILPAGH